MLSRIRSIYDIVFGPNLVNVYDPTKSSLGKFQPHWLELWPNLCISTFRYAVRVSVWCSPLLIFYLHRRNLLFSPGALLSHVTSVLPGAALVGVCAFLLTASVFIRALGRYNNAHYRQFAEALRDAHNASNAATARGAYTRSSSLLSRYDFDTTYAPVDFIAEPSTAASSESAPHFADLSTEGASGWRNVLTNVGSYVLTHTVGVSLMYPGYLGFMQSVLGPHLSEGRARLIEKHGGKRYLIYTADGNGIDVMFIDRRNRSEFPNGQRLMVTCEGNAGFYEIGSMLVAVEAGYSVLGWNHPGFAGSTGTPFPASERHAIDAVMQFARRRLAFQHHDTMLYAWSIGGYSATWTAASNNQLSALVLDATFDDVVPLAVTRMPSLAAKLVETACRRYMNLHPAALLERYHGPLLLIRRSRDEIITTRDGDVSSNRGNYLLAHVLKVRYPALFNQHTQSQLWRWMAAPDSSTRNAISGQVGVDDNYCHTLLSTFSPSQSGSAVFPMNIGETDMSDEERSQLLIYLAGRYMMDYDNTHCSPLPSRYLEPMFLSSTMIH